jgi:hypothetical protein
VIAVAVALFAINVPAERAAVCEVRTMVAAVGGPTHGDNGSAIAGDAMASAIRKGTNRIVVS